MQAYQFLSDASCFICIPAHGNAPIRKIQASFGDIAPKPATISGASGPKLAGTKISNWFGIWLGVAYLEKKIEKKKTSVKLHRFKAGLQYLRETDNLWDKNSLEKPINIPIDRFRLPSQRAENYRNDPSSRDVLCCDYYIASCTVAFRRHTLNQCIGVLPAV